MQYLTENSAVITAALAVIAVLILGVVIFRFVGTRIRGREGARLGISEYHEIDKDRRLVLIRRDDVEHLLLIGGGQDLVIESGIDLAELDEEEADTYIERAAAGPAFTAPRPVATDSVSEPAPPPLRPAPRPAVFGEKRPVLRTVTRDEPRLTANRTFGQDEPG